MASTKTLEQRKNDFINRLKDLYPDYRLISEYVNGDTFVELKHVPTKEVWKTKPRYLNGKRQAPGVARANQSKTKKSQYTHEEYEQMFYKRWDKSEYELVSKYTRMSDKVEVLHKKCNKIFTPSANNMIQENNNKKGCRHCYGKRKKSLEEYNELFQAHEELKEYTILSVESKSGHVYGKVRHNCDLCSNHEFNIRISDMISKHRHRCPKCKDLYFESKAVRDIKKYLTDNGYIFEQEKKFETCKNITYLPFDFYLPELQLLIEYDGVQHFKPSFKQDEEEFEKIQHRDALKTQWCEDNNINLLRITYRQDHIKTLDKYLNKINQQN